MPCKDCLEIWIAISIKNYRPTNKFVVFFFNWQTMTNIYSNWKMNRLYFNAKVYILCICCINHLHSVFLLSRSVSTYKSLCKRCFSRIVSIFSYFCDGFFSFENLNLNLVDWYVFTSKIKCFNLNLVPLSLLNQEPTEHGLNIQHSGNTETEGFCLPKCSCAMHTQSQSHKINVLCNLL